MTQDGMTQGWAGPPRFLPPPPAVPRADSVRHIGGATYAVVPGYRPLQLDVWVPPAPDPGAAADPVAAPAVRPPLVVWIHGGAWLFGDRRYLPETLRPDSLFEALVAAGLAVATIDYRHSREAPFPAQLHDAKAAVRWLRAHADDLGVDTSRVGVWGESAGGHLAALVALTGDGAGGASGLDLEGAAGVVGPSTRVDVAVDWYGVNDLATMPRPGSPPEIAATLPPDAQVPPEDVLLAGAAPGAREAASPVAHVGPHAPPFLLVHGTADGIVPPAQSQVLAERLTAAGGSVELALVDDADHVFRGHDDVDALVTRSVAFLARHLVARPR